MLNFQYSRAKVFEPQRQEWKKWHKVFWLKAEEEKKGKAFEPRRHKDKKKHKVFWLKTEEEKKVKKKKETAFYSVIICEFCEKKVIRCFAVISVSPCETN